MKLKRSAAALALGACMTASALTPAPAWAAAGSAAAGTQSRTGTERTAEQEAGQEQAGQERAGREQAGRNGGMKARGDIFEELLENGVIDETTYKEILAYMEAKRPQEAGCGSGGAPSLEQFPGNTDRL